MLLESLPGADELTCPTVGEVTERTRPLAETGSFGTEATYGPFQSGAFIGLDAPVVSRPLAGAIVAERESSDAGNVPVSL